MPALYAFPFSSLDSFSAICYSENYLNPIDAKVNNACFRNGYAIKDGISRKRKPWKKHTKLSSFVRVARRAFRKLCRNTCVRFSASADNNSLLASEDNRVQTAMHPWDKTKGCRYDSFDDISLTDKDGDLSWDSSADFLESVHATYTMLQPWTSTPCKPHEITTAVVKELHEVKLKRAILVSSGMQKLEDSRACVLESRHRLEALKTDIVAVREDIQKARALFGEVERGIRNYKWELVDRDSWMLLLHPKVISSSPSKNFGKSHLEEMYREHRIFVEEMKYHFKWQHGVII